MSWTEETAQAVTKCKEPQWVWGLQLVALRCWSITDKGETERDETGEQLRAQPKGSGLNSAGSEATWNLSKP